jgi:hypothetical protein
MSKYFQAFDSLPYSDTSDRRFRLLRAYHRNDTSYLQESYNELEGLLKYKDEMLASHICEEPDALNRFNYKEAYRFSYGASFCDTVVNLTIGKYSDSTILELYLYEYNEKQTECRIIKHSRTLVSNDVWEVLINGVRQADFWGLDEENGRHGVDGSGLTVTGYQKPINAFKGRYKKVYRWSAEEMTIGILFKNILNISGTTVQCFHF